jgi:hypothetical protein
LLTSSAKIYGYRVDALHAETQKLNSSIQQKVDEIHRIDVDTMETGKKVIVQRSKPKASSYIVTDLSSISLSYELDFHPFQPSRLGPWPGGVGFDSIYADMVSYTMYSSSDFPLINGFINLNSRVNRDYDDNESMLDMTMKTVYDLLPLRDTIKDDEEFNHLLGRKQMNVSTYDNTISIVDDSTCSF